MGDEARGTHYGGSYHLLFYQQRDALQHASLAQPLTAYTAAIRMHRAIDANGHQLQLSADHHAAAHAAWTAITHQGCLLRRRAVHLGMRQTRRPIAWHHVDTI